MVGLVWTVYMMHGLSWQTKEGGNLITNFFCRDILGVKNFKHLKNFKQSERKGVKKRRTKHITPEKETDGDENIPKEQSKPETYSIREIVPREEVSDDSKVTQEEQ